MLTVLSKADNSQEFMRLIPEALGVMRSYVFALRMHKIPVDQLHVAKRLSKKPDEYTNLVPQAVAAIHLAREGQETHAGQTVSYVVTNNKSRISANRALPAGFLEDRHRLRFRMVRGTNSFVSHEPASAFQIRPENLEKNSLKITGARTILRWAPEYLFSEEARFLLSYQSIDET